MSGQRASLALAILLVATAATGGIERALVVVEAAPGTPGSVDWGAPPRFVLMDDGQVFVGGTWRVETAQLDKEELRALRKRIEEARKLVEKGGGPPEPAAAGAIRVRFPGDEPREFVLDPSAAQGAPQALVALVTELVRYDHPALVPFSPSSYALTARSRTLIGGCRPWTLSFPIERALAAPVTVPAAEVFGWPTGALPASVCVGERRYAVTLRPLLPGEQP